MLVLHGGISDAGGGQALTSVYGVSDDSWQEATLSWSEQPQRDDYLARRLVTDQGQWWAFDVTEFVRAEQRRDGVASLALAQNLGGAGLLASFGSREFGALPPRLEIVPVGHASIDVVAVTGDEAAPDTRIDAVVDGDYATRWSNESHGATLRFDVGSVQPVTGLGAAFHEGTERIQFFELRISTDGETWSTMLAGQAAGYTDELQRFFFAEPVPARYVELVGFGNSKNGWNSVTEVEIYGC